MNEFLFDLIRFMREKGVRTSNDEVDLTSIDVIKISQNALFAALKEPYQKAYDDYIKEKLAERKKTVKKSKGVSPVNQEKSKNKK